MGFSNSPLDESTTVTGTSEAFNATSLETALKQVYKVAEDAPTLMTPVEILEHAARSKSPYQPEMHAGLKANVQSLAVARGALRDVAASADKLLHSLLCRQLYERAVEEIGRREKAKAAEFSAAAAMAFGIADDDGSGQLEFSEVRYLAADRPEADAILATLDTNKDGKVSKDEWVAFFTGLHAHHPQLAAALLDKSMRTIFERDFMSSCLSLFYAFDKDASGLLEMRELMVALGESRAQSFVAYVDQNGDKALSLEEWMTFLMNFWRFDPEEARAIVAELTQTAAETATMPALPPSM